MDKYFKPLHCQWQKAFFSHLFVNKSYIHMIWPNGNREVESERVEEDEEEVNEKSGEKKVENRWEKCGYENIFTLSVTNVLTKLFIYFDSFSLVANQRNENPHRKTISTCKCAMALCKSPTKICHINSSHSANSRSFCWTKNGNHKEKCMQTSKPERRRRENHVRQKKKQIAAKKEHVATNKKAGLCFVFELSVAQRLILFPLFRYYFCCFLLRGIIHLSSCIWRIQSFSMIPSTFLHRNGVCVCGCANPRNHSLSLRYHFFFYRCVNKTTEPKTTIHSLWKLLWEMQFMEIHFSLFLFHGDFFPSLCIFFFHRFHFQIGWGKKYWPSTNSKWQKSEFVYFDNWKSKQLNNAVHLQANKAQHNAIIVSQFSN